MEKKPSLYISNEPWYINFVGVDRATGEVKQEGLPTDPQIRREITERFMRGFGYVRKKDEQDNHVKSL